MAELSVTSTFALRREWQSETPPQRKSSAWFGVFFLSFFVAHIMDEFIGHVLRRLQGERVWPLGRGVAETRRMAAWKWVEEKPRRASGTWQGPPSTGWGAGTPGASLRPRPDCTRALQ